MGDADHPLRPYLSGKMGSLGKQRFPRLEGASKHQIGQPRGMSIEGHFSSVRRVKLVLRRCRAGL